MLRYHSLQPTPTLDSLLLNYYCCAVLRTPVPMAASTGVNDQQLVSESDDHAQLLKASREALVSLEAQGFNGVELPVPPARTACHTER